jgi:hypothetical protein
MKELLYSCKYCSKKFLNERTFMKHSCTQMLRSREIQTIIGQQAYKMYCFWLEKQRRKAPPPDVFMTSSYYSSFVNFANWSRETGIPDPQRYIELMIEAKISPALWRRSEAYQIFLEYIDKRADPLDQALKTCETILMMAGELEIEPNQVFSRFTSGEISQLIFQRQLSPWFLFCSKSFKGWIEKLHPAERIDLMKNIGVSYWSDKLEKSPEIVKQVKSMAEELEL